MKYLQKAFRLTSLPLLKPEMAATLQLAIKTGIAALVTYLSAIGLSLPSPIWAVVSAVISKVPSKTFLFLPLKHSALCKTDYSFVRPLKRSTF